MKKLLVLAFLACASCAPLQAVHNAATTPISDRSVYVAVNTFNTLEVAATNYLRLPRCGGSATVCRDVKVSRQVIFAVREGRVARERLELGARTGDVTSLDALQIAIGTLQTALNRR